MFKRAHLNVLIILALILAGAAPACKFISGQMSLIEICGLEGVKTIAIPAEQSPDQPTQKHKDNPCNFCFANASIKNVPASATLIAIAEADKTYGRTAYVFPGHQTAFGNFQSRAPPAVL